MERLCCPQCGGDLRSIKGELRCVDGHRYFVRSGIPRLLTRESGPMAQVSASFGFEWQAQEEGRLEQAANFGRVRDREWKDFCTFVGMTPEQLRGRSLLDVGCGLGSLAGAAAEAGMDPVIGVEMSSAVDLAARREQRTSATFIQASGNRLPFSDGSFEVVYSMGVVHHNPDPRLISQELARVVAPGGTLFIWAYSKRFNPFRFGRTVVHGIGLGGLSAKKMEAVASLFAHLSLAGLALWRTLRSLPGLKPQDEWGKRALAERTHGELKLTWLDALLPAIASQHDPEEVAGWLREVGLEVEILEDPNVAIRARRPAGRRRV